MQQKKIKVDFFCDSMKRKQGLNFNGIKTLSPEELKKLDPHTNIFISNNYVSVVNEQLKKDNFKNIYDCVELFENTNFDSSNLSLQPAKIERWVAFYKNMTLKDEFISKGLLNIKSLDVQVTERCSLKCKDCSNLMQYYTNPQNSELNVMLKSIDRFMECVNQVYEFRVLGGDPFMNKELHKVIDHLVSYDKVQKIAVYTNARFVPSGENLSCLKNNKVVVDISNYGLLDPKKKVVDKMIETLKKENIRYSVALVNNWQDCGRITPFQKRTEKELHRVFNNCCNSDILSLLHGKLYRCPFSANATNLKAIPYDKTDIVDLFDENVPIKDLKLKIKELTYDKKSLTACNFCNGRDYQTPKIDAAIQAPRPMPLESKQ
tara:strand:- start:91 stop:1218 length:1128 start_codon:yes stop_codon:yes gene_type:complete